MSFHCKVGFLHASNEVDTEHPIHYLSFSKLRNFIMGENYVVDKDLICHVGKINAICNEAIESSIRCAWLADELRNKDNVLDQMNQKYKKKMRLTAAETSYMNAFEYALTDDETLRLPGFRGHTRYHYLFVKKVHDSELGFTNHGKKDLFYRASKNSLLNELNYKLLFSIVPMEELLRDKTRPEMANVRRDHLKIVTSQILQELVPHDDPRFDSLKKPLGIKPLFSLAGYSHCRESLLKAPPLYNTLRERMGIALESMKKRRNARLLNEEDCLAWEGHEKAQTDTTRESFHLKPPMILQTDNPISGGFDVGWDSMTGKSFDDELLDGGKPNEGTCVDGNRPEGPGILTIEACANSSAEDGNGASGSNGSGGIENKGNKDGASNGRYSRGGRTRPLPGNTGRGSKIGGGAACRKQSVCARRAVGTGAGRAGKTDFDVGADSNPSLFSDHIRDYFKKYTLDGSSIAEGKRLPEPKVMEIGTPNNRGIYKDPQIIGIDDRLGSLVEDIKNNIKSVPFQRGKGGREFSFTRAACTDNPQGHCSETGEALHGFMPIGKAKSPSLVLYQAVQANEFETKLIGIINDLFRPGLEAAYKGRVHVEYNLLHYIIYIGKPYGKHNDSSQIHCRTSDLDTYRTSGGFELPDQESFVTFTIVLTRYGGMAPNRYTVSWVDDTDDDPAKCAEHCSLQSTAEQIHIQGPGSQYNNIAHYVKEEGGCHPDFPNDWRCVMTCRTIVVPSIDDKAFKRRLRLYNKRPCDVYLMDEASTVMNPIDILEGNRLETAIQLQTDGPGQPTNKAPAANRGVMSAEDVSLFDLTRPLNTDNHPQCSQNHYEKQKGLVKCFPLITEGDSLPDLLCSARYALPMLEQFGVIVQVRHPVKKVSGSKRKIHKGKEYEYVDQIFHFNNSQGVYYPTKGEWYNANDVARIAGLQWEKQSMTAKNICRDDSPYCLNTIISKATYKVEAESNRRYINRMLGQGGGSAGRDEDVVMVFGSGGAPQDAGSFGANTVDAFREHTASWAITEHTQRRTGINDVLHDSAAMGKVVAYFITGNVYNHLTGNRRPDKDAKDVFCMGFFVVEKYMMEQGKTFAFLKQALEDYAKDNDVTPDMEFQQYLRFQCGSHVIVSLREIPECRLSNLARMVNGAVIAPATIRRIVVDEKNNHTVVGMRVDRSLYKNCLTLREGAIGREQLLQHYLDNELTQSIPNLQIVSTGASDVAPVTKAALPNNDTSEEIGNATKVGIRDFMILMTYMTAAVSMRGLGDCIQPDPEQPASGTDTFAVPLTSTVLGTTLRTCPTPCPFRQLDQVNIALRLDERLNPQFPEGAINGRRAFFIGHKDAVFVDKTFKAIIACLTGGPAFLSSFVKRPILKGGGCLPSPVEWDLFNDHLCSLESTNKTPFSTYIRNQQYTGQSPLDNYEQMRCFVESLSVGFANKLSAVIEQATEANGSVSRRLAVLNLAKMLSVAGSASGRTQDHWMFVSYVCICAVEELYCLNPFGTVKLENVVMGPGAINGLRHLQGKHKTCPSKERQKKWFWLDELIDAKTAKALLDHVGVFSVHELECNGLERMDDSVYHKLNGRPVNFVDVEHWLCKLYLYLRHRTPAWLKIKKPTFTKKYCHPLKFSAPSLILEPAIAAIFRTSKEAFANMTQGGKMLPRVFLFEDEEWENDTETDEDTDVDVEEEPEFENDAGFIQSVNEWVVAEVVNNDEYSDDIDLAECTLVPV